MVPIPTSYLSPDTHTRICGTSEPLKAHQQTSEALHKLLGSTLEIIKHNIDINGMANIIFIHKEHILMFQGDRNIYINNVSGDNVLYIYLYLHISSIGAICMYRRKSISTLKFQTILPYIRIIHVCTIKLIY